MSYAIIESGGKQFRVAEGREFRIPLVPKAAGESVDFVPLLLGGESKTTADGGQLGEWRVRCRVVAHGRSPKVIVFKFKRRKQYSRQKGHRQDFTTIKVEKIEKLAD